MSRRIVKENKKNISRLALIFALNLIVFIGGFLPVLVWGQDPASTGGLVQCGLGPNASPTDCRWTDLVSLFRRVVDFIFLNLMIPLAVIAIVYAGIKILIGRDKPGELIKAKGSFYHVAIGIFMALGAYAIVRTILSLLVGSDGAIQQAIQQVFG